MGFLYVLLKTITSLLNKKAPFMWSHILHSQESANKTTFQEKGSEWYFGLHIHLCLRLKQAGNLEVKDCVGQHGKAFDGDNK